MRQWVDQSTGYPCMIHRGPHGAWCGYVALPTHHPLHGADCHDAEDVLADGYPHGGITWEGVIDWLDLEADTQGAWWLGFDCAHAFDVVPTMAAYMPIGYLMDHNHYWSAQDVTDETTALALKLAIVAKEHL